MNPEKLRRLFLVSLFLSLVLLLLFDENPSFLALFLLLVCIIYNAILGETSLSSPWILLQLFQRLGIYFAKKKGDPFFFWSPQGGKGLVSEEKT